MYVVVTLAVCCASLPGWFSFILSPFYYNFYSLPYIYFYSYFPNHLSNFLLNFFHQLSDSMLSTMYRKMITLEVMDEQLYKAQRMASADYENVITRSRTTDTSGHFVQRRIHCSEVLLYYFTPEIRIPLSL